MDVDPFTISVESSNLLEVRELHSGRFEFLSTAWDAAEALTSPDLETRRLGLERLIDMRAARVSPLLAYLLVTRLTEPDDVLRAQVTKAVADVLGPDQDGQFAAEPVRSHIALYLAGMRTRPIFALLQTVATDPSIESEVITLMKHCSYAGAHMAEILLDRNAPLAIRKLAVKFIGRVGYLDGLPALERLQTRLETRKNGNNGLSGDKAEADDEASLLPLIEDALNSLRAP
jgi:hypothetical protein